MHPLIKEFLSWSSDERKHVIKTALFPYETKYENRRLWAAIVTKTALFSVIASHIIGAVYSSPHRPAMLWTFIVSAVAAFDIFYWCIFVQLMDAVRERVEEERQKRAELFDQMMQEQKKAMFEKLRAATGRQELNMDPISIVAATIEARQPKEPEVDPTVNPLRAALDGTLRPEHLSNPEDDTTNEQDF